MVKLQIRSQPVQRSEIWTKGEKKLDYRVCNSVCSFALCSLFLSLAAMNPLTQIKNTQKATRQEIAQGISESASWHAAFKHSAYIFVGGLPYDLTEGDILAVFSQYGEIVDLNLVKDKETAKQKGFAFLAYEDQRSTVLAVDNLNGVKVASRTIRVEHVGDYKTKRAEVCCLRLLFAQIVHFRRMWELLLLWLNWMPFFSFVPVLPKNWVSK